MKNPESFTITETEPIPTIMDSNTVIREMGAGQMPMEIPTVPGMMKTIISEHSWKNMNSRAAVAPLM